MKLIGGGMIGNSNDTNYNLITEKELEHIHLYLNHNFPYPKMNSGLIEINQNYPENFIGDTEYFGYFGQEGIAKIPVENGLNN